MLKTFHIFSHILLKLHLNQLGSQNLKRFEIFDRGRECDLNMKSDLKRDVCTLSRMLLKVLHFWNRIKAHIEGELVTKW